MGTIMTLSTDPHDIIFIDEPEAFLHPPQARLLGEVVVEMTRDNGPQVIAATHSSDFLQGVLNAAKSTADVSVVRVTRPSSSENRVAQVEPSLLASLYKDPLLRHSKILDGIFYKGVVLCEAESDCTYYSVTLAHLEDTQGLSASDILFAQCGGKDRLKKAYEALTAAGVPTAVIADVDILADRSKFEALFGALGGETEDVATDYSVVSASVSNRAVRPRRALAVAQVDLVLKEGSGEYLSTSETRAIAEVLRSESGWKRLKNSGVRGVDNGAPSTALSSILEKSARVGLFIVPVGELERFHPTVSGNKQEWLRQVLEQELYAEETEAHSLLLKVREFIAASQ